METIDIFEILGVNLGGGGGGRYVYIFPLIKNKDNIRYDLLLGRYKLL